MCVYFQFQCCAFLSSGTRTLSGFPNQTGLVQRNRRKAGVFAVPEEGGGGKWFLEGFGRHAKNLPSVWTCWWHQEGQIYDLQNIIWLARSRQTGKAHSLTHDGCAQRDRFRPYTRSLFNCLSDIDQTQLSPYTHTSTSIWTSAHSCMPEWQREEKHVVVSPLNKNVPCE